MPLGVAISHTEVDTFPCTSSKTAKYHDLEKDGNGFAHLLPQTPALMSCDPSLGSVEAHLSMCFARLTATTSV